MWLMERLPGEVIFMLRIPLELSETETAECQNLFSQFSCLPVFVASSQIDSLSLHKIDRLHSKLKIINYHPYIIYNY